MNRYLTFLFAISMTLSTLPISLRAANKPRVGKMEKTTLLWTNEDLERLRALGLISIVGQPTTVEDATAVPLPSTYVKTQDPEWYAKQAVKLRAEIKSSKFDLPHYPSNHRRSKESQGDDRRRRL
jgi:hypothetical protein